MEYIIHNNNNMPCWKWLKKDPLNYHTISTPAVPEIQAGYLKSIMRKPERTSTFECFLCSVWVILVLIRMYQNGELYTERKQILKCE
jgi:hypothetical protein